MNELAVVVLLAVALAVYVTWTASRLDRLHARVDAAWAALDVALVRRSAAARALAVGLAPGPATTALLAAATSALQAGPVGREARENDLTRALRGVLPGTAAGTGLAAELAAAAARVGLARSVHNSAVADARLVRARRVVRLLHLAGHRVLPTHFDIDVGDTAVGDVDVRDVAVGDTARVPRAPRDLDDVAGRSAAARE